MKNKNMTKKELERKLSIKKAAQKANLAGSLMALGGLGIAHMGKKGDNTKVVKAGTVVLGIGVISSDISSVLVNSINRDIANVVSVDDNGNVVIKVDEEKVDEEVDAE